MLSSLSDGPIFANVQNLVSATVGESVTIDCIVSESNPSVQSITLTVPGLINNQDITSNQEYTVDAISADFNGTVYTCTADNGERTTSQSHTLIVLRESQWVIIIMILIVYFSLYYS